MAQPYVDKMKQKAVKLEKKADKTHKKVCKAIIHSKINPIKIFFIFIVRI